MRFVVDAQSPPALALVLRDIGCDAVAVREIGLRDAKDSDIFSTTVIGRDGNGIDDGRNASALGRIGVGTTTIGSSVGESTTVLVIADNCGKD